MNIEITKDEKTIKNAYRERLGVTNPEDDPEGFKRLRKAYDVACRYAREEEKEEGERPRDTSPSGLWLERVAEVYRNMRTRRDTEMWRGLFEEDIFFSLEEEENCRLKMLGFLMEHYRLPTEVWKLIDQKLSIVADTKGLREKLPANFLHYLVSRCERGEDLNFSQFEGAEEADYDQYLDYYDRCWQALQENRLEEAEQCVRSADGLGIKHPVMEISRANVLVRQGRVGEAVALMEEQNARYPKDTMICYNFAEILWNLGRTDRDGQDTEEKAEYRKRCAEFCLELKAENDSHYMANLRLSDWYYEQKQYRQAKKCAEKVLAAGSDDVFLGVLVKINKEIEKELEAKYRETSGWEPLLELCWCYLQDGKICQGIGMARKLEGILPREKTAEYKGLLAKLYVEQAEYEDSVAMTKEWERALEEKIGQENDTESGEEKKDRDRLRQAHLIRMQCYHNLGFKDKEYFSLALREADHVLTGSVRDAGILLEIAQIYLEMEEYEKSLETAQKLVDEYQIFAAYASSMEVYRRLLDASGVVRMAGQSLRYFPNFSKAYEYLAKVYLDLDRKEELEKVLEDAKKNGVKSAILEAYAFQMSHEPIETGVLNGKLKEFRKEYLGPVEEGALDFYEKGLPVVTEYLYYYPDDFMLVERAIFHRAAHHYEEALQDFEKALYVNPVNPYALNGLSFVYKYRGDYERALFFIKKAILYMDRDMSAIIYTDMGNLYALLGDSEMALEAYKQYECLAGVVRSSWFGDNLAELHLRVGQTEEAEAVCERFYKRDKWGRYENLVKLYNVAGQKEKARRTLDQWGTELRLDWLKYNWKTMLNFLSPAAVQVGDAVSYPLYYHSYGWTELLFGSAGAALRAFDKMFRSGLDEHTMEGKIGDAVFACILCGDDRRGRKYAKKLQEWLAREQSAGSNDYFNRDKAHLQMEFLAAYYTETTEKLEEILGREERCEICHACTCPLCKEMEGARLLFLLRAGRRTQAKERLRRNLEIQPWDEYMLAVKHVVFGDTL